MSHAELKRILRANGCYIYRHGANHEIWYSPITGKTFPVGRHDKNEVPSGTLKNIMRASGIK